MLDKIKILELVNQKFTMMDQQLVDALIEMEEFKDDEYDIQNLEIHKNNFKLEYINKGYLPKEVMLEDSVFDLSRKIVHFIFRNGIIEDMHAGKYSYIDYSEIPKGTPLDVISQLSNRDMKELNKFMMDRVGYILHLIKNAEYTKLHYILDKEKNYGDDWDYPDIEKIEMITEKLILIENGVDIEDIE